MSDAKDKRFLTYEEQVELLRSKNLIIMDENKAINTLKRYSYYSLISGYKDIFKIEKNGKYKDNTLFEHIEALYVFDDYLRNIFLHEIIRIEKHIKSLYSYSFCTLYGDNQSDYLNATNYNYEQYQDGVNKLISTIQKNLDHSEKYPYVNYNQQKYGTVPFWIIIQTLTIGNISKIFFYSRQELQSQVAREFENIYGNHLSAMLNVLSKFRNVCAHGERLYNYKTKKSILVLPIHSKIENYNPTSKNDLFNVVICFKYLSKKEDFSSFINTLSEMINIMTNTLGDEYSSMVLKNMGFPQSWKDIDILEK